MDHPAKCIYGIIVSYNGSRFVCQALDSLRSSTYPVRTVVVDNASTDETVRAIQQMYPEVKLFCMPTNLGFGQANNYGICHALSMGADYVLLLNQDARVNPKTMDILVSLSNKNPEFGIISPLHLDYQGTGIDTFFLQYIQENVHLVSDAFFGRLQGIYEVPFVNAAIWLINRRVFEEVGGFDPLFFMYGEDADFCRRARFHGFKIGIIPDALAYHWHMVDGREKSSIKNKSNWLFSGFVYKLKDPEYSFVRNLISLMFAFFVEMERKLEILDFKGCIAAFYSILRITSKIFTARKHYYQCRVKGYHWL